MKRLLVTTDVNEALHFVEGFNSEDFYHKRKPINEYASIPLSDYDWQNKRAGFEIKPMTVVTLKDRRFSAHKIAQAMIKEGLSVVIEDDEEGEKIPWEPLDIAARELILREALYKMPGDYRSTGRENIQASNNLLLYSNSPNQIRAFQ